MLGTIFIKEFVLQCHLGETPEERAWPQNIIVNIECDLDITAAVSTDDLSQTLDYRDIHSKLLQLAETSEFQLIETFAVAAITSCFENSRVERVKVSIEKPFRLAASRSIGIVVEERRSHA